VGSVAVFADFEAEPMPSRPADQGIDFSLLCSVTWVPHDARVGFMVRHVGERRLVVTSLEIAMPSIDDPIGKKMLSEFPLGELLAVVREWIVNGGEPNGATTKAFLARGLEPSELPEHDEWSTNRAQFVGMLRSSADGPPRGRKRKRDDAYLRELAIDYVRIAMGNDQNPREDLARLRHKGVRGIASDLTMARAHGWLAPASKGQRKEQRPGPLLIAAWEQEGYPEWHPNHRTTKTKGRRR
jgi:hypothetical protein